MNDTTVMGAPRASDADVLDYVGAVRAWLGDLPPEEVDDLTAGMEADLAERAAESGARLGDLLGEPEAYASELRAAAGLPPRPEGSRYGVGARRGVVAEVGVALRAAGARTLTRSPWLRDLRPVWWVARGVALGGVVAAMLGGGRFLLMVLGAALSFWAGRVLAAREVRTGPGTFLALVNVVAALALVPVAVWVLDHPHRGRRQRGLRLRRVDQRRVGLEPLRLRRRRPAGPGRARVRPVRAARLPRPVGRPARHRTRRRGGGLAAGRLDALGLPRALERDRCLGRRARSRGCPRCPITPLPGQVAVALARRRPRGGESPSTGCDAHAIHRVQRLAGPDRTP